MNSDECIDDIYAPWVPASSLVRDLAVASMKVLLPHCSPETLIDSAPLQTAAQSGAGKDPVDVEQDASDTDSDLIGQSQPSDSSSDDHWSNWSNSSADLPPPSLMLPQELEGIVDIDPDEGRRRGAELMAMLMSEDPAPTHDTAPKSEPCFVPSCPVRSMPMPEGRPPSHARASEKPAATSLTSAAPLFVPSWATERQQSFDLHSASIIKAARDAFGDDLSEVEGDAEDGFTIRLCSDRCSRRWEPNAALNRLHRCLWPLLDPDAIALVPTTIPKRSWLSLHVMSPSEMQRMKTYCCWDFARSGMCRRGTTCRWPHTQPMLKTIDIEVAY